MGGGWMTMGGWGVEAILLDGGSVRLGGTLTPGSIQQRRRQWQGNCGSRGKARTATTETTPQEIRRRPNSRNPRWLTRPVRDGGGQARRRLGRGGVAAFSLATAWLGHDVDAAFAPAAAVPSSGLLVGRWSKYARLTQYPCFWARVEEAREQTESAKGERNPTALAVKLESLCEFEHYSGELVESKEVSVDVLAPQSSYSLWVEWKELKLQDGPIDQLK
ncbi:hypothetical protein ABZP36_010165 [Zizania latifolia]